MRSKTLSCKATAFCKNLSRFWPVWVGYSIFLAVLQMILNTERENFWFISNMAESIVFMGAVNCCYAFVVAQTLFGDLFNSRMCNGLHALPLKREHWFGVHMTTGILFSVIPTALMTAVLELMAWKTPNFPGCWEIPLLWLLGSNLQYLFFFGLAVLCAMFVGSRFAMAAVYGIVNFFSALLYLLVYQIYTPLLYGVLPQSAVFELLCPVLQITATRFVDCERVATGNFYTDAAGTQAEYVGEFTVIPESWLYLGALSVMGIFLLVIARGMYRKRRLECAGDFLAVRWLEPVFQVVFTVFCGAAFQGVFALFFGTGETKVYSLLIIGLTVGWFAGRMLLERTTKVFRLKNLLGFALMTAFMVATIFVTKLDPLNIAGWVPEQNEITSVSLSMGHRGSFTTEDPEEIEDILRLHELAVQERVEVHPDYNDWYETPVMREKPAVYISLSYHRSNGWITGREYYILAPSEAGSIAKKYCSRIEVVVPHVDVDDADDFRHKMQDISYISVRGEVIPEERITEEFLAELADAILADCESGAMLQSVAYHPEPVLDLGEERGTISSLYLDMSGEDFFCYLDIYSDCGNTLAVLEKTGVLEIIRENPKFY